MKSLSKYLPAIFLLATLLISRCCPGQKPAIGIKLGIVFSNISSKEASSSGGDPGTETAGRAGITGGFYLNIASGEKLIFRPGLEIVSKGVTIKYGYSGGGYSVPFTYLDFPINILHKINFTKGHLLVGGGPYIGLAIKKYYTGYPAKTDVGLNALIAYETSIGFSLNLNYSYGLSNASVNTDQQSKFFNRYLGITLGYLF